MGVKGCDIDSLIFGQREVLLLIALRLICAVGESCRYAETIVRANCNDTVFTVSSTIKEGKTSPPKHYTDDTLLSAMENANNALEDMERKGIGTPAPRAGILEKLIKTGFAERKGDKKTKYFIPTHKGIFLITVLPEVIKSAQLTAEWEEHLKQIERGTLSPQTFLEGISLVTKDLVSTYKVIEGANTLFPPNHRGKSIGKCPRCGSEVIEKKKGARSK